MQIMEGIGEGREVPMAWLGHYAATCFRTACALFGNGEKEEGYQYLERTFDIFEKWETIPDGEEMDVGEPLVYGGIKVIKGKNILKFPDGIHELIAYEELFTGEASMMYYGMTAPHGWEWFDPVRKL